MSKTKQQRRAARRSVQAKKSWLADLPLLPVVVGGVILAGAAVLIIISQLQPPAPVSGGPIDGIKCQSNEQLAVHYHAHLSIIVDGNETFLPAGVGIDQTDQCLYWMHVHNPDGIIHMEAPKTSASRKFTLGNIFDIWGKKLDSHHVGDATLTSGQKLEMFVDGKPYTGNPRSIVLGMHTLVVLEITPPEVTPPPDFTFPAGL